MPEYPDIELYRDALDREFVGHRLERVFFKSPFLLRSVEPPVADAYGQTLVGTRRIGKRIAFAFDGGAAFVLHLMIAGRLQVGPDVSKLNKKIGQATLVFDHQCLFITEASKKKRASLHATTIDELDRFDPGGLDVFRLSAADFAAHLRAHNHTLKRALTDPRLLSGIGNAYSDEILFEARLSPITWTTRLDDEEVERLHSTTVNVLARWKARLVAEHRTKWPKKVTAFQPEMYVHGRYGEPCRVCESPVQRIRYAANEANYCAQCQNGGKLLADRSLSRLMKGDWPRSLDALEELKRKHSG